MVNVVYIQRYYYFSYIIINFNQIVFKGLAFDYIGCYDWDCFYQLFVEVNSLYIMDVMDD